MTLSLVLASEKQRIEIRLQELLHVFQSQAPASLHRAMEYGVMAGGKRLRPLLTWAAHEALHGQNAFVLDAACCVEFIHTYSLIQDDLPCMDNDDLRRGKPTCHKVFGEAIALLASDALLSEAMHLFVHLPIPSEICINILKTITSAIGSKGLVGGQVLDLENKAQNEGDLRKRHQQKTGALLRASVQVGAYLADATKEQLQVLTQYGEKIGLAFQMMDDVLDVTVPQFHLGKTPAKDHKMGKITFVDLWGIAHTTAYALELTEQACDLIHSHPEMKKDNLVALARFVATRKH